MAHPVPVDISTPQLCIQGSGNLAEEGLERVEEHSAIEQYHRNGCIDEPRTKAVQIDTLMWKPTYCNFSGKSIDVLFNVSFHFGLLF